MSRLCGRPPAENRIYAVRIRPPSQDPRVYIKERRDRINKEDSRGHFRPLFAPLPRRSGLFLFLV